jgi:putative membrane protein
MTRALALWACNVAALFVADALIGGIEFDDAWKVVIAGAVFGVVNWLLKPLATLLALPLIILTLGIALFFVNLLMLALTAWLVPGFDIDGFWPAVGGTIVVWAVNALLHVVLDVDDRRARRRERRAAG